MVVLYGLPPVIAAAANGESWERTGRRDVLDLRVEEQRVPDFQATKKELS
jgi:hypothetical protein